MSPDNTSRPQQPDGPAEATGPRPKKYPPSEHRSPIASLANTFEWLITAFILAFVFRAFVMEAFRIPTGSMADTLKGAHFRLCCRQCGYRYDYDFNDQRARRYRAESPRCPSCGYFFGSVSGVPVSNGDRILVLKCIYQFHQPKRWDVIVFKNPNEPRINYIKRLIGRPNETIELIDGDVYIDGKIARKPPKVQNELWMPVYNNDYQPVRPAHGPFNGHNWQQPFENTPGSNWDLSAAGPTVFQLDSPPDQRHLIYYNTDLGNDFTATYAYDDHRTNHNQPYCSDLMLRFYAQLNSPGSTVGAILSKYAVRYQASVEPDGTMVIGRLEPDGRLTELAADSAHPQKSERPVRFEFANVDHLLIFRLGDQKLTFDLGRGPADAGIVRKDVEPQLAIFGSGQLRLSNLAIFRDIYYTDEGLGARPVNAAEGHPFTLHDGEYFVLGDNSPSSFDSRLWKDEGIGNNNKLYRPGIVPDEYLVGKAVFVYWPSGFRPTDYFPLALVPNVGQMRFIYGGSDESL